MDLYHEGSDSGQKPDSEDDDVLSKFSTEAVLPISQFDLFAEVLLRKQRKKVTMEKQSTWHMVDAQYARQCYLLHIRIANAISWSIKAHRL